MIVYWALFFLPLISLLYPNRVSSDIQRILFWIAWIVLVLIIGFRHEIGGDWDRYLFVYNYLDNGDFLDKSKARDVGYEFIYWFFIRFNNGIYLVNLIIAIFFVTGLLRFCRTMPLPWIALFISIPFLVVIVSMGYTRQAAALGFLMWGLVDLTKGRNKTFYASIIIGSLFHYTVIFMLIIGSMYTSKKIKLINTSVLFFSVIISLIVYSIFSELINTMYYIYIETKYNHSQGAVVRVFMTSLAGATFFYFRDRFKEIFYDEKLWYIFSLIGILLLPLAFFFSTFIDRIAIYFVPLQLVVFSRVLLFFKSKYKRSIFLLLVVSMYFLSFFLWLNFSVHSEHWLPYQNFLFL